MNVLRIKPYLLLLGLNLFVSCVEQKLKAGNNLIWDGKVVKQIHCPDKECINGRSEYHFSKKEIIMAISKRYQFEFENASKVYDENRETRQDLIPKIKKLDELQKSDLTSKVETELENGFQDKEFKQYIFAATSGIIYMREREAN